MYRICRNTKWSKSKQSGTALIVTLVLVLLATLLGLFALNVGLFEQRSSASDVRARLVRQTAESALSQGVEYFKANRLTALDTTNTALWQQCVSTDTTFPCGTVEQCANGQASGTGCNNDVDGVSTARRSKMFRFIGGGTRDVNGNGSTTDVLDTRSLPLDRLINTTATVTNSTVGNGFAVNYGVGALLCLVKTPATTTSPTECTTDTSLASTTVILTLTAVGSIPGESADTTLTMMYGTQSSIASPVGKPPVVASGTVTATGTLQIVTNPNGGGPGVPVSIWTRLDAEKTGTPNTCYMDGFIRDQTNHNTTEIAYEGTKPPIITCDTCLCTSSLSYTDSGNKQSQGIDILDVDAIPQCTNTVTTNCKPNLNVKPTEFPCDLFNFTFGDQAWTDSDGDNFCETRTMSNFTAPDGTVYDGTGGHAQIGEDEKYLYTKADFIIPKSSNTNKVKASQLATCSILQQGAPITASKGTAYGIIWDQGQCNGINSNQQAGTPDWPVLLVEDGKSVKIQGRMFGLLFVRPDLYDGDTSKLDPTTGAAPDGSGCLEMDGGAAIYGSVVVQGQVCKINGTSAIIYNANVLTNLGNEPSLNKAAPVPGSWSDRFAY